MLLFFFRKANNPDSYSLGNHVSVVSPNALPNTCKFDVVEPSVHANVPRIVHYKLFLVPFLENSFLTVITQRQES